MCRGGRWGRSFGLSKGVSQPVSVMAFRARFFAYVVSNRVVGPPLFLEVELVVICVRVFVCVYKHAFWSATPVRVHDGRFRVLYLYTPDLQGPDWDDRKLREHP